MFYLFMFYVFIWKKARKAKNMGTSNDLALNFLNFSKPRVWCPYLNTQTFIYPSQGTIDASISLARNYVSRHCIYLRRNWYWLRWVACVWWSCWWDDWQWWGAGWTRLLLRLGFYWFLGGCLVARWFTWGVLRWVRGVVTEEAETCTCIYAYKYLAMLLLNVMTLTKILPKIHIQSHGKWFLNSPVKHFMILYKFMDISHWVYHK